MDQIPKIRVCLFGTYDEDTSRVRLLESAMSRCNYEVVRCHRQLWSSSERQATAAKGGASVFRIGIRIVRAYWHITVRFLRLPKPDFIMVAYPGYLDAIVARALCWIVGNPPIVFDVFLSIFDTIVSDRKLATENSLKGRVAHLLDKLSCRAANLVLADTPQHADFFSKHTGISRDRFAVLWVGAEDRVFHPCPNEPIDERLVLFYGTYIPLQGIRTIVRAASLLGDKGVRFKIVGHGQESAKVEELAEELKLENVEFVPWVPYGDLPAEISRAAVCLGIFGQSDKASRVVPNKVFQCVAVGRPVITGDSKAIRGAFVVGDEIAVCEPGNPTALSAVILELLENGKRREAIAIAGRARYQRDYCETALASLLAQHIKHLLGNGSDE